MSLCLPVTVFKWNVKIIKYSRITVSFVLGSVDLLTAYLVCFALPY